jgi:hypothetical protein
MPCNSKCGFCGVRGHRITHCDSEEGNRLFNDIRSRAIDYIVLEDRSIHERAKIFYQFLIRIYYVKELKLIVSKIGCDVSGNIVILAARFTYKYFLKTLGLQQFPGIIDHEDNIHIRAYLDYWKDLSQGIKSVSQVNQELDDYFDFVNGLQYLEQLHDSDFDFETAKFKFPINVVMKPVDLTEEKTQQYFECAICMEEQCSILDKVEMSCKHSFCMSCVSTMLTNSQNNKKHPCCALCRADFTNMQVHMHTIMEDYNTRFCFAC